MPAPTVVDPRTSLALWLRAGRTSRRLTLDDVSRTTKINRRVLEKLESGQLDGLPADVFVRGFVRSFARCVGLDEGEALDKLVECAGLAQPAPPVPPAPPLIELMPEPERLSEPLAAPEPVVVAAEPQPEQAQKKKRSRKRAAGTTPPPRGKRRKKTSDAPVVEAAVVEAAPPRVTEPAPEPIAPETTVPAAEIFAEGSDRFDATESEPDFGGDTTTWTPTMPPLPSTPSVPWRRPSLATTTASATPSLVIDDADPERAERQQADRAQRDNQRVSFLPPILMDREDRSQRQGGLTLAVIILLIAATLTLSYLMRRPTVTGDGVTMIDSQTILA
jgi:hypothetical protein